MPRRNVKMLIDEGAALRLTHRDYYQWVFDNKPEWQQF